MTRLGCSQSSPLPHWRLWPPLARPTSARTVAAMDPAQACFRAQVRLPVLIGLVVVACTSNSSEPARDFRRLVYVSPATATGCS